MEIVRHTSNDDGKLRPDLRVQLPGGTQLVVPTADRDGLRAVIEEAGAYAIVLEAIPPDLAARVTAELKIPTIGIGAGRECDGQVLVCTDLLGLARGHQPKFAKRFAELGDAAVAALRGYVADVQSGDFPGPEHAYKANVKADVDPAPRELPPAALRH